MTPRKEQTEEPWTKSTCGSKVTVKKHSWQFCCGERTLRCYQRLLFLNALRMVVAFRSYKRDISERNKELSVKDRRDALPFLVFVQMREVGISIPWKRIRPKWKKGRSKQPD